MRIVFFGTPEFAVPSLEALLQARHTVTLVVAQPDRPAGRGMKLRRPPVAELAVREGIALLQPSKIRTPEFLEAIRREEPDLAVVVAYGRILPGALLGIPKHGFINLHASLLPKYRGAAPIQRAIEAGDRVTGVTIMRIDEELDHGPMLGMAEVGIGPEERAPSVSARLAAAGGPLLVRTVDALEDGSVVEIEQDHAAATHAAKIEKEEGRVDWSLPARELYDRFRAFDPWPGLFTVRGEETIRLTEVSLLAASGGAGTVLSMSADGVDVACAEGALRIVAMQRPGKRAAAASDVARGLGLEAGARFS